jgi:O-antigen/teichoic acid export membrane protein
MLAAFGSPKATAVFGVAASVAFGMLMLPNAITTALLPELAGAGDSHRLISCARRALAWTLILSILLSAVAAVVVPFALPFILGSAYSSAGIPFAVLCLGVPLIATSGVIGTTLLSVGALRPLGIQVSASLGVNLLGLALLVPALGAVGAASATVACEFIGLILLAHAARTRLPGFLALHAQLRRRIPGAVTT